MQRFQLKCRSTFTISHALIFALRYFYTLQQSYTSCKYIMDFSFFFIKKFFFFFLYLQKFNFFNYLWNQRGSWKLCPIFAMMKNVRRAKAYYIGSIQFFQLYCTKLILCFLLKIIAFYIQSRLAVFVHYHYYT